MPRLPILVTGGAGFIGSHVVDGLLASGEYEVYCIDNFDPFYDPAIKRENLQQASGNPHYHFLELDLRAGSPTILQELFDGISFYAIIHLAARAGVRPSLETPVLYYDVNVKGTLHLLEFARLAGIHRFLFASSSSVYGNNPHVPWREDDLLHEPVSPYAATKLAAEELGHVYAGLYGIQFIALRLFTVYGPRQRPDLAIQQFYNRIKTGQPISVFGDGNTTRDYTYVSDITWGILAALHYDSKGETIFNLGNSKQVSLRRMIQVLEDCMHAKALINWQDKQPGDVDQTSADISKAARLLGYQPKVNIEEGIRRFVQWKEQRQVPVAMHDKLVTLPAGLTPNNK